MYQKIGEINIEHLRKDFPWVENNVVYASEWIIEKIRNNHPEMGNYWTELPNLLSRPDKLFRDRDYLNRVVLYKDERKRLPGKAKFLRVVIEIGKERNELVTFYMTRRLKQGETPL
jgi:hypothetical protein